MSERLVITGGPRTGKTTLAQSQGGTVRHADDWKAEAWSEQSELTAKWFDDPGPWTVEGTAAVRALRKWLVAHPEGRPADRVVFLGRPRVSRTDRQAWMAKAVETIFEEVRPELERRGVVVERQ